MKKDIPKGEVVALDFCCGGRNFYVPADGCNTYLVTFRLLRQFEDDLHLHVHPENNILFLKALKTIN